MSEAALDLLVPRDHAAVRELIDELGVLRLGASRPLAPFLPRLAGLLRASDACSYSLRADGDGYEVEGMEAFGTALTPGVLHAHRTAVRTAPRSILLYDPGRPEPAQRNRVRRVRMSGLSPEGQRVYAPSGIQEQLRVLVCDGPGLLAWVGALSDRPFDARDVRVLDALRPALTRRLRAENLLGQGGALARPLLETAIEHIAGAAFVLRGTQVVLANAAARELLGAGRRAMLEALEAAVRGGGSAEFELTRHRSPGEPEHVLAVARARPGVDARLAFAARRWRLTARQREVLALMVKGLGNKGIAAALRCTEKNVEFHVSRLLARADCSGRAQLIAAFWSGGT